MRRKVKIAYKKEAEKHTTEEERALEHKEMAVRSVFLEDKMEYLVKKEEIGEEASL